MPAYAIIHTTTEADAVEYLDDHCFERVEAVASIAKNDGTSLFIFAIDGAELSECDDMLSELIDLPEGIVDGFAAFV